MYYKVILKRGDVSGYIAECPALPGCVSQGRTIEEALDNIKDAIHSCLEVLNERAQRIKARHDDVRLYTVTV